MATPPFIIDETSPASSNLISQFPTNEQSFRDIVESWLLLISTNEGVLRSDAFGSSINLQAADDNDDVSYKFFNELEVLQAEFTWDESSDIMKLIQYEVDGTTPSAVGVLEINSNRVPAPASQAAGDLLYRGATTWERLALGTAGKALVAGATAPEWAFSAVPVGAIMDYAGTSAPSGWLFSYGQSLLRASYPALFTAIGTTYGAADGTHFSLPDLRGYVVAGKDDMGGSSANRLTDQSGGLNGDTLGDSGGAETHTLTTAQLSSHSHGPGTLTTDTEAAHTHTLSGDFGLLGTQGGGLDRYATSGSGSPATDAGGAHSHTVTGGATATAGSGSAHNNVQPTFILNKIIYAGV